MPLAVLFFLIPLLVFNSMIAYWAGVQDTMIRDQEHYQEVCAKMWPFPIYKCKELE